MDLLKLLAPNCLGMKNQGSLSQWLKGTWVHQEPGVHREQQELLRYTGYLINGTWGQVRNFKGALGSRAFLPMHINLLLDLKT